MVEREAVEAVDEVVVAEEAVTRGDTHRNGAGHFGVQRRRGIQRRLAESGLKLFGPHNPTDPTKMEAGPRGPHMERFVPMRDSGRRYSAARWEQRICQLSYNAKGLFKLNPRVVMSANCRHRNGKWHASTPQTADLVISDGYDENYRMSFKESILWYYDWNDLTSIGKARTLKKIYTALRTPEAAACNEPSGRARPTRRNQDTPLHFY